MQMRTKPARPQYHFAKRVSVNVQTGEQCETQTVELLQIAPDRTMTFVRFITYVNPIRPVCRVMLGVDHTIPQRMLVGVGVMAVGVAIAKVFGHAENHMVAGVADALGYGLHGLGLTPFIEYLAEKYRKA